MQRSTLVPIADFLRGRDASQLQVGQVPRGGSGGWEAAGRYMPRQRLAAAVAGPSLWQLEP